MKIGDDNMNSQKKFKELLKENGLKATTQRIAILEMLSSNPGKHLTAEEIYDCVRQDYPEIGLATVYRTIQLLSELGLIEKLILDDGYLRYEIGTSSKGDLGHHHHHLICLHCGKIDTFQDDLLENLESRIKEIMGFDVVDHEVKLYGHCKQRRGEK